MQKMHRQKRTILRRGQRIAGEIRFGRQASVADSSSRCEFARLCGRRRHGSHRLGTYEYTAITVATVVICVFFAARLILMTMLIFAWMRMANDVQTTCLSGLGQSRLAAMHMVPATAQHHVHQQSHNR